jgi:hypothetical protein
MQAVLTYLVILGLVPLTVVVLAVVVAACMHIFLDLASSEVFYTRLGIKLHKKYNVIVPGLFPQGTKLEADVTQDHTTESIE